MTLRPFDMLPAQDEGVALPLKGGRDPVVPATSTDLKIAVREKFGGKGHQVFFEVGNDTGARVKRHADAVAIGIWPSTGHAIHGFEIKISRGDWLRELADPGKSQSIFAFCHRWSLVTPHGLVAPDELPPGWGLYSFKDGRLRETVMPKRLEPLPPTPGFMAALVRRAGEQDNALLSEIHRRVREEEIAKRDAEVERRVAEQIARRDHDRTHAAQKLKELEEALGEPLTQIWDLKELAAAIRVVRRLGVDNAYGGLGGLLVSLDRCRETLADALAASGLQTPKPDEVPA